MTSREIAYTSVSVLFDSVPSWGRCHRRLGQHVILKMGEDDSGCFKCVRLVSRSPNVLQVHTSAGGGLERCLPTEEAARAECPTERQVSIASSSY